MADDFISDVFDLTRAKRVSCCAAIIWSERGGYLFSVFYVYFHYVNGRSSKIVLTAAAGPPRRGIVAKIAENDSISDIVVFILATAGDCTPMF